MKKLLTCLLALLLLCSICAQPARAEEGVLSGTCGDNVTWTLDAHGTLTISGEGEMKYYYGTGIDCPFAPYADRVKTIVIEDGVTKVSGYIFMNYSNLISVVIADSVTEIGLWAFRSCEKLTGIILPNNLTSVGYGIFDGCKSLTDIVIPGSVESIGYRAFADCVNLTSIVISSDVTSIGDSAFFGCKSLTDIVLPDGLTSIGSSAFSGCESLTDIILPEGIMTIGDSAFNNCKSLTSISIPQSVTSIGGHVFYNCQSLAEITIPSSVSSVGNGLFYGGSIEIGIRFTWNVPDGVAGALTHQNASTLIVYYPEGNGTWAEVIAQYGEGSGITWIGETYACYHTGELIYKNMKNASCAGPGYSGDVHCVDCDELLVVGQLIYGGDHNLVKLPAVAPTCTANGLTEGEHCTGCGAITKAQEVIPALPHTEVIDPASDPTCTEAGKAEGKHCSACGEILVPQEEISALGHKPGTAVVENEVLPDCLNDGQYDMVTYCKVCQQEVSRQTYYRPIASHNYVEGKCTGCGRADPEWEDSDGQLEVTRTEGQNRFFTAFNIANQMKENLGVDKFDNIIIASGSSFADALSGSYLASVKNAPILLSHDDAYNTLVAVYIKNNLKSGGTVYILGGKKAVPEAMEKKLEGYDVRRLAGDDRFATNLKILEEAGLGNKELLVCTGLNYADSLSASACKRPILLVWNDLNKDQEAFLEKNMNGNKIYVVGGMEAVSFDVQWDLSRYGRIARINGKNRFETSVLIAREFFDEPRRVVLAYAGDYPDGLCGGALAASRNAPLLLTSNSQASWAKDYVRDTGITKGSVLGGTKLISDKTVRNIFSMEADALIPKT